MAGGEAGGGILHTNMLPLSTISLPFKYDDDDDGEACFRRVPVVMAPKEQKIVLLRQKRAGGGGRGGKPKTMSHVRHRCDPLVSTIHVKPLGIVHVAPTVMKSNSISRGQGLYWATVCAVQQLIPWSID